MRLGSAPPVRSPTNSLGSGGSGGGAGDGVRGSGVFGASSGGSGGRGGGAAGCGCGCCGCFAMTGGSRPNTPRSTSHRSTMLDLCRGQRCGGAGGGAATHIGRVRPVGQVGVVAAAGEVDVVAGAHEHVARRRHKRERRRARVRVWHVQRDRDVVGCAAEHDRDRAKQVHEQLRPARLVRCWAVSARARGKMRGAYCRRWCAARATGARRARSRRRGRCAAGLGTPAGKVTWAP